MLFYTLYTLIVGGIVVSIFLWRKKKKTTPLLTGLKAVHAEIRGTETIITLDPAQAVAKHKHDKQRGFFATLGATINSNIARWLRVGNDLRETRAALEQERLTNPTYIPPAPMREQLLRYIDRTLEAAFRSFGKWIRSWRRALTPVRIVKWQRRRDRARERAAHILAQPNVPVWKIASFQRKTLFWIILMVSALVWRRHFWAGLICFTLTICAAAAWHLYQKHQAKPKQQRPVGVRRSARATTIKPARILRQPKSAKPIWITGAIWQWVTIVFCAIASLVFCYWHLKTGFVLFTLCAIVGCSVWWRRSKTSANTKRTATARHLRAVQKPATNLRLSTMVIISIGAPCILAGFIFPKLALFGGEILFLLIVRWAWTQWRTCENFVFRPLLMGLFFLSAFLWVATIATHIGSEVKWRKTGNNQTASGKKTSRPLPFR